MEECSLRKLLEQTRSGEMDIDDAIDVLRRLPFEDLASARIDTHRALRCGFGEVIFAAGKTPSQVAEIFAKLAEASDNVLATRATCEHAEAVIAAVPAATYDATARAVVLRGEAEGIGHVAVVAAGTSDLPVAAEARITAEVCGARVTTHYDVGVAGLHRLLAEMPALRQAKAVVAVAGMEGALASVVGGLVAVPVIAVPTSVGYGASFGGVSALLTMLNSCASGISVVNIDNGFAGGYNAALINRLTVAAGD
ncbi:MAG: nickel pincer cofactor biosynthesis protein LarB [Planctomycetes bacterium]|nr:nickel pincer cofactor biosynthesis protein LarB [Planctomycetota bacterium]